MGKRRRICFTLAEDANARQATAHASLLNRLIAQPDLIILCRTSLTPSKTT
jgi:hypothetical protein